jgi:hypothetical protein
MDYIDGELNIVVMLPANTAGLAITASIYGGGRAKTFLASRDVRCLAEAFRYWQENFWADHPELSGDDAEKFPVILKIPGDTVELSMAVFGYERSEDGISEYAEVLPKLTPAEIRKARDLFVKYIGDDDWDATYSLAEDYDETEKA